MLRYLWGGISLTDGLQRLSKRFDLRIGAIHLPFADAAVDVDSVRDYTFAQELVRNRQNGRRSP